MKNRRNTAASAVALWALLASCNAVGEERAYDTSRPNPVTPVQSGPADSTAGVARSTARPGVAGDTISRSSDISAPPGKTPDPKRP
jgi:hypothetical protein